MRIYVHAQDDRRLMDVRIPARTASLQLMEREPTPTDPTHLHKESFSETHPECLLCGIREEVDRGGKSLFTATEKGRQKPNVGLEGIAFRARAFGDQWGKLLPMQCHINKDGREIGGKAGKTKCAGDSR